MGDLVLGGLVLVMSDFGLGGFGLNGFTGFVLRAFAMQVLILRVAFLGVLFVFFSGAVWLLRSRGLTGRLRRERGGGREQEKKKDRECAHSVEVPERDVDGKKTKGNREVGGPGAREMWVTE